jgi:RHH-type proline utilization regulon transcriptional repressor/proline dehydrogenase/delta 1-pyrroline-5-carboxylate dehydrogenase
VGRTRSIDSKVEDEIREVGAAVVQKLPAPSRGPVAALDERAMRLTTEDPELRTALFRLVDVTPACRNLDDLASHLAEFADGVGEPPPTLAAAMRAAHTKPGRLALGAAVATGVRHMAHRFIAAPSPAEARGELRRLWDAGIGTSVDLLGEATLTEAEADAYAARCSEALATLAEIYAEVEPHSRLEQDAAGPLPRANLSVKVTALTPLIRPEAPGRGIQDAASRLVPLLARARDLRAHLHIDMESLDSRETTLGLLAEVLGDESFRDGPSAGVVLQAYLRDAGDELQQILAANRSAGRRVPLTVRLVKGAYWDHEVVEAGQHGWAPPVFSDKAESDRSFEALSRTLVDHARENPGELRVAIASHNLRSVAHAIAYNRLAGGTDEALEFQVLRGLGDDLAHALAGAGFRVRSYCPVGDLVAGMAYLVRRLLENTANESFLAEQARGAPLDTLLAAP